jgi:hypothetical protein
MSKKQKLELTWVGKENRPRLEPRILLEEPKRSYHAAYHVGDEDIFDNRLIFGDNLLALKALEQEFAGKVKCVFIDPPYNTGSAFEHYEDGLEHSIWLGLTRDRLEIIRRLLSQDGSLWMTIDDKRPTTSRCCAMKFLAARISSRRSYGGRTIRRNRLRGTFQVTMTTSSYLQRKEIRGHQIRCPALRSRMLHIGIRTMIRGAAGSQVTYQPEITTARAYTRSRRRPAGLFPVHRTKTIGASMNRSFENWIKTSAFGGARMETRFHR